MRLWLTFAMYIRKLGKWRDVRTARLLKRSFKFQFWTARDSADDRSK